MKNKKVKKGMTFLKLFFNMIWFLSCIWGLTALFLILPGKLKIWYNQDDYQIGMFEVEKRYSNYRKGAGSSGLIGKVDNKEKIVSFFYYRRTSMKWDNYDFQKGTHHQVWYHKDFKSAFIKFKNSEKFELPKSFIDDIYFAVYILIVPFLILSGIKIYLRRKKRGLAK